MDRPSWKRVPHGGHPAGPGARASQPHPSQGGHVDSPRWVGRTGETAEWARERGGGRRRLRLCFAPQDIIVALENVQSVLRFEEPVFLKTSVQVLLCFDAPVFLKVRTCS